jgi:hypothetical protein
MPLLTVQLLFMRTMRAEVLLDVIVLEAAEVAGAPRRGEPVAFEFSLPGDAGARARLVERLDGWTRAMRVATIDVVQAGDGSRVCVTAGPTAVTLGPPQHAR